MKSLYIAFRIFILLTLITGILYPVLVYFSAQFIFPDKANGSLIMENNKIVGSELIGQLFDSTIYFSSRPSAISNNPLPSGGSNYGITNSKLKIIFEERKQQFIRFNQLDTSVNVPAEMLFSSASGLDPHISAEAAYLQLERVTIARSFNENQKNQLIRAIREQIEPPQYFILGEERVNVLLLNLMADKIQ